MAALIPFTDLHVHPAVALAEGSLKSVYQSTWVPRDQRMALLNLRASNTAGNPDHEIRMFSTLGRHEH